MDVIMYWLFSLFYFLKSTAIMLARIKLTYPEIRDAIWNIDDNRLTIDNLMAIRQYIPTKEEIEIIQEYDGDIDMLGNAERYFKAVSILAKKG